MRKNCDWMKAYWEWMKTYCDNEWNATGNEWKAIALYCSLPTIQPARGREDASLCPNVCWTDHLCTCANRLCYIGLRSELSTSHPSPHFTFSLLKFPPLKFFLDLPLPKWYYHTATYFADCTVYLNKGWHNFTFFYSVLLEMYAQCLDPGPDSVGYVDLDTGKQK